MTAQTEEKVPMTPEEREAHKLKMKAFYEESLPLLEAQLVYERKLTEITEARNKRFMMEYQLASMMAPEPEENEIPEPKERKLKSEK